MEEICLDAENDNSINSRAAQSQRDPRSSERSHRAAVLCLGLLSVLLLVGLLRLSFHYHYSVAEFSTVKANLTERLQTLIKERSLLKDRITEMTEELESLQSLSKQVKTCPAGWRMFSCSCYLLSDKFDIWDKGRSDCRNRGADLVVIDSHKEKLFLSTILSELTNKRAWIGLNDREEEGTWKWIDGTQRTLMYWAENQPDNGNKNPAWGEEDCAFIFTSLRGYTLWNDVSCEASHQWICEKIA